ncbi:hypothetical protein Agub_g5433, partial [Astrephomene gubernaculifera]
MTNVSPSHQWVVGLCSVVFDIDVGQRVEHLVPANCLSTEEKQDVAFHSFPDSMSMELYARTSIKDSTFFFRVRRRGVPGGLTPPEAAAAAATASETAAACNVSGNGCEPHCNAAMPSSSPAAAAAAAVGGSEERETPGGGSVGSGAAPVSKGASADATAAAEPRDRQERFLYGFVFCRQRQDASLRRGGEQAGVVVLSEHPLSAALGPLAAVAGHSYFAAPGSRQPLQQVYDEVLRWPPPVAGAQLQLTVGFTALSARLPAWGTLPAPSTTSAPEQYGGNTLPHMRSSSSARSLTLPAGPSARRLQVGEDGSTAATPTAAASSRSVSRTLSGLSLGSSSGGGAAASGPMGHGTTTAALTAAAATVAAAAAAAASPFSTASGQQQQQQPPGVVPPAQQQLHRGSSSSLEPSLGSFEGAATQAGAAAGPQGQAAAAAAASGALRSPPLRHAPLSGASAASATSGFDSGELSFNTGLDPLAAVSSPAMVVGGVLPAPVAAVDHNSSNHGGVTHGSSSSGMLAGVAGGFLGGPSRESSLRGLSGLLGMGDA